MRTGYIWVADVLYLVHAEENCIHLSSVNSIMYEGFSASECKKECFIHWQQREIVTIVRNEFTKVYQTVPLLYFRRTFHILSLYNFSWHYTILKKIKKISKEDPKKIYKKVYIWYDVVYFCKNLIKKEHNLSIARPPCPPLNANPTPAEDLSKSSNTCC